MREARNSSHDQSSLCVHTPSELETEDWTDLPQVQDSGRLEAEAGYAQLGNYMSDVNDELRDHSSMESTSKGLTSAALDYVESNDSRHIWGAQELGIAPQSGCLEHDTDPSCPRSNPDYDCRTGTGLNQEETTGNSSISPKATSNSCKPDHSPKNEVDTISETSAEVLFAFPGIYQETLDQWAREREAEVQIVPQRNEGPACIAPRDSPSNDPPPYQEYEDDAQGERAINANHPDLQFPRDPRSNTLDLGQRQPLRNQALPGVQMHDQQPTEDSPCSERSTTYEPSPGAIHLPVPPWSLLPVSIKAPIFGTELSVSDLSVSASKTLRGRVMFVTTLHFLSVQDRQSFQIGLRFCPKRVIVLDTLTTNARIPFTPPKTPPRRSSHRQKLPQ